MFDETIDILLSTFNSEKYLTQQVESLFKQTISNWRLIVRDDGSTDDTLKLLKELIQEYPDKIILLSNKQNLGVIKSFETLLKESSAEYIMFCDHDDVWLEDKIEVTLLKMKEIEQRQQELPVLVFTDLTVVDSTLNVIHKSFWKFSKLNPRFLSCFNYLGVCNGITGCTVMINKKAKEVSLPFSKDARMHDWWIGLNVSKFGKIGFVDKSTILYRQHNLNQIGATEIKGTLNYIFSRIQNVRTVFEENRMQFQLIKKLDYGNFVKYLFYKMSYFFRARFMTN